MVKRILFALVGGLASVLAQAQVEFGPSDQCEAIIFNHHVVSGAASNPDFDIRISTGADGSGQVGLYPITGSSNLVDGSEQVAASVDDAVEMISSGDVVLTDAALAFGAQSSAASASWSISAGSNDGEEASDNTVSLTGTTLTLGETIGGGSSTDLDISVNESADDCRSGLADGTGISCTSTSMYVGSYHSWARFDGITIDPADTVNNAYMYLTGATTASWSADADLYIQDSDNPTWTSGDMSALSKLSTTVNWAVNSWVTDVESQSPDIKSLIIDLIDNGTDTWDSGDSLAIMLFAGSTSRATFRSINSSSGNYPPRLTINYTPGGVADSKTVGLRFTGVSIPQGANITAASIDLHAEASDTSTSSLTIKGEDVDDSAALSTTSGDISGRTLTTASQSWSAPSWTSGTTYTTPSLMSVVQEIVDRGGWASGADMTFVFTGTGTRRASSCDASSCANPPVLRVSYDSGASGATEVAVRFLTVQIPSGSTMVTASLEIEPDGTTQGTGQIYIYGADVDDQVAFTTSNGNLSDIPKTAQYALWNPGTWFDGVTVTSPDVALVMQEIILRGGWATGQDMAFVVNGSAVRLADAYDGSAANAVKLTYTYSSTGSSGYQVVASKDDGTGGNWYRIEVAPCPAGLVPISGTYFMAVRSTMGGDTSEWSVPMELDIE